MRMRPDLSDDLLQRHLSLTDTAPVKSDMMQEFEVVLTQMPYVGGAESRMSDFFMRLLGFMAIGRVLQRRGVPKDVIAELELESFKRHMLTVSEVERLEAGHIGPSRSARTTIVTPFAIYNTTSKFFCAGPSVFDVKPVLEPKSPSTFTRSRMPIARM